MTLSEGIVKINSKALESSELKKFDKLEKEGIALTGAVTKGKTRIFCLLFLKIDRNLTLDDISFLTASVNGRFLKFESYCGSCRKLLNVWSV